MDVNEWLNNSRGPHKFRERLDPSAAIAHTLDCASYITEVLSPRTIPEDEFRRQEAVQPSPNDIVVSTWPSMVQEEANFLMSPGREFYSW